ncbi:MAG: hypothetical protein EPO00_02105 [Chloroflexota bacterium]|nr:MAG: hypothetical protein EPO00_02105 [Chloroflexota bacterium]
MKRCAEPDRGDHRIAVRGHRQSVDPLVPDIGAREDRAGREGRDGRRRRRRRRRGGRPGSRRARGLRRWFRRGRGNRADGRCRHRRGSGGLEAPVRRHGSPRRGTVGGHGSGGQHGARARPDGINPEGRSRGRDRDATAGREHGDAQDSSGAVSCSHRSMLRPRPPGAEPFDGPVHPRTRPEDGVLQSFRGPSVGVGNIADGPSATRIETFMPA